MTGVVLKLALAQVKISSVKTDNIEKAVCMISENCGSGKVDIALLPECFNSPYRISCLKENAESVPDGETCSAIAKCAFDNKCFIVGSIPEKYAEVDSTGRKEVKYYNTCVVFNRQGDFVGKYRKNNLVKINIADDNTFDEEDIFQPGRETLTFDVIPHTCKDESDPGGRKVKVGLGICRDLRYPDFTKFYRDAGCSLVLFPCAFNMVTGPYHWDTLVKSRALDNQLFAAGCNPARHSDSSSNVEDSEDKKQVKPTVGKNELSYANSKVVDPWGKTVGESGTDEKCAVVDLDLESIERVRKILPLVNYEE